MRVRNMNMNKLPDVKMTSVAIKDTNQLVFERQLGHKPEIPGSGQWRMLENGDRKCWCCDNQIYTIIFWSINHGNEEADLIEPLKEENLISQIEKLNNHFKDYKFT
jgi:hypothetical protein